jgi:acetoin utilization deacetylase AcuC-like enzyme
MQFNRFGRQIKPCQTFMHTTPGFERIGAAIAAMGLPTVYVQEGGYLSEILASFLKGVLRHKDIAH